MDRCEVLLLKYSAAYIKDERCCVQDVGMGDKAVTSFLGCCVQLLQILMEVTGLLVKNQCPLSFINNYVSNEIQEKSMEKPITIMTANTNHISA